MRVWTLVVVLARVLVALGSECCEEANGTRRSLLEMAVGLDTVTVTVSRRHAASMSPSGEDCRCDGEYAGYARYSGIAFCVFAVATATALMKRLARRTRNRGRLSRRDVMRIQEDIKCRRRLATQATEGLVHVTEEAREDEEAPPPPTNDKIEPLSCPVCLDALENTRGIVRPPNCHHHFHRECLVSWIDTSIDGSARALECPACCASMLPASVVSTQLRDQPLSSDRRAAAQRR